MKVRGVPPIPAGCRILFVDRQDWRKTLILAAGYGVVSFGKNNLALVP